MLTVDQIAAASAAANRRLWFTIVSCMAGGAAYMGTWMAVAAWHGPTLRVFTTEQFGPVVPELLMGLTVCPVAFLIPGGLLIFVRRERLRPDPRLTCPVCNAAVGSASWVVATRRCPKCAKMIVADPTAGDDPADPRGREDRLIAVADFTIAHSAFTFQTLLVPTGIFAYLGSVAGVKLLAGPAIAVFIDRHLGQTAQNILAAALAWSFFLGMVGGLGFVAHRWRRDPRLACPWCGRSLADHYHVALSTRNCGHCGREALTKRASDFA